MMSYKMDQLRWGMTKMCVDSSRRRPENTCGHNGVAEEKKDLHNQKWLAERGFDPRTSGLWAQHASAAPLCFSFPGPNYKSILKCINMYNYVLEFFVL